MTIQIVKTIKVTDDQPEVQLEEDPDYKEQVKKVKESQELINSRFGESRSFYIKARDVSKYGPTKSCPGCRFVLGEISTHSGHTKMCKKRIMKLMEDDTDDINRVTQWYVNKGIDKEKITVQHEGPDDKEDKMECEPRAEQPSGPVTNSSSSSSDNVDSQMQGAQAPDKRSIIKDENDRLKKKQKTDDDVINEPESKRKKLGCLNMMQLEDVDTREIKEKYIEEDPMFVVANDRTLQDVRSELYDKQRETMKYFINLGGQSIATNSAAAASMLKVGGLMEKEIDMTADTARTLIRPDACMKQVEESLNRGMKLQKEIDKRQLFVCNIEVNPIDSEEMNKARESADRCHQDDGGGEDEYAWDDVNNCSLDPSRVKDARKAEIEYFRKMRVYKKVPIQRCKDMTGRPPIKVRWVDTNKGDEVNHNFRSRLVAKDFKKYSDPDLYSPTPPVAEENYKNDEPLDHERFKKYQSVCARANFLATDRYDLQFASKECCRAMSKPTNQDWAKLKRLGRYLVGKPRLVFHYPFQDSVNHLTAYSDASWASNARPQEHQWRSHHAWRALLKIME